MLCEPFCSDNEEKQGDNLTGNPVVNLQNFTTNIEKILVRRKCTHEEPLQMKIYQENFIYYVEDYFWLYFMGQ